MDKLKKNKILSFIIILSIISFLFGILFITIVSKSDILTIKTYLSNFFNDIYNNNINFTKSLIETLTINFIIIFLMWLLGISVIGIPAVIFIYFFKIFSLGFSLSSFVLTYKFKGLIFGFIYLFPNEILKYLIYLLITFNAVKLSKLLLISFLKKKEINFNNIMYKYLKILFICIIMCTIFSIYETYAIPFIFNKLHFLIK